MSIREIGPLLVVTSMLPDSLTGCRHACSSQADLPPLARVSHGPSNVSVRTMLTLARRETVTPSPPSPSSMRPCRCPTDGASGGQEMSYPPFMMKV